MESLRIVAVCTGNICRSPLSEYFLKDALNPAHFAISSAGTRAVRGGAIPEPQVKIAHQLGLDAIVEHKPHQITVSDIQHADLLLTATLRHRRHIVRTLPAASGRVFTMREYAHLATHVEDADIIELLAQGIPALSVATISIHQLRGTVPPPAEDNGYDVVDPFGEDKKTYRLSAEQLVTAHGSIVAFLRRIEQLAMKLDASAGMTFHTSQRTQEPPLPAIPLRAPSETHATATPLGVVAKAPAAPQEKDSTAPGSVETPRSRRSTRYAESRPSRIQTNNAEATTDAQPKNLPNTLEFPAIQVDTPLTLGRGYQLGLDPQANSQRSGKHKFNPKNPDPAASRHQTPATSLNVPAPKAARGKHRRYSK